MHQNEIFIESKKYSFGKKIHFKGLVHPKMKILSFNYSPSCRFKPVRPLLRHIFAGIWEQSIDSKGPYTIKVQKRSKDIGKIIHVTSGVKP